jgi:hypothetical protein
VAQGPGAGVYRVMLLTERGAWTAAGQAGLVALWPLEPLLARTSSKAKCLTPLSLVTGPGSTFEPADADQSDTAAG